MKFVCLKLCLTHVFDFKWRRGQPCRWLSGTNNWVRAHVGDVIIVWRNTHNNTEPNAIWFPATLTDTVLNIQGIEVKYRMNGNCNTPATESRLWGTKWYYLFSDQVRMLRRGAFGIFYTSFNWTFKNCISDAVLQRANNTHLTSCKLLMNKGFASAIFSFKRKDAEENNPPIDFNTTLRVKSKLVPTIVTMLTPIQNFLTVPKSQLAPVLVQLCCVSNHKSR